MLPSMESLKKAAERVEQSVLETVGNANKTELEPELVQRLAMAEDIRHHCERLLAAMQKHIPHDPRLTASFTNASHPADGVAQAMKSFAEAIDRWPETALKNKSSKIFWCGQDVYKTLCRSEKSYVENAAIHFVAPMKQFLAADVKKMELERKELMTARVDMDSAKNRAVKHPECAPEAERATHSFARQKEIVEEEIRNLEHKLHLVCSAVKTYVDDYVSYLQESLEGMTKLQSIINETNK